MGHSRGQLVKIVDRPKILKTSVVAAVGSAVAGSGVYLAGRSMTDSKQIATRQFGKTGRELPILDYGGAAIPGSDAPGALIQNTKGSDRLIGRAREGIGEIWLLGASPSGVTHSNAHLDDRYEKLGSKYRHDTPLRRKSERANNNSTEVKS